MYNGAVLHESQGQRDEFQGCHPGDRRVHARAMSGASRGTCREQQTRFVIENGIGGLQRGVVATGIRATMGRGQEHRPGKCGTRQNTGLRLIPTAATVSPVTTHETVGQ